jgi:hypothetical protein
LIHPHARETRHTGTHRERFQKMPKQLIKEEDARKSEQITE